MPDDLDQRQRTICRCYGADFRHASAQGIAGVSRNFDSGELPLHGLRLAPESGETGWFLWAGEYSGADDFFQPVPISHLTESHSQIIDYLGLPPGWRCVIYEHDADAWLDDTLLHVWRLPRACWIDMNSDDVYMTLTDLVRTLRHRPMRGASGPATHHTRRP